METWKTITDYPKYKVSNMGNVLGAHGKALKPYDRKNNGYLSAWIAGRNFTIHSLVMREFVGIRPAGMVINHINGIKWDNRLENLEYCTQSHNIKEDFIHKRRSLIGEKNTQSKIKESDVLDIMSLYKTGKYSYSMLAKKYDMSISGISNIFNGHCWSYLTGIKPLNKSKCTAI